MSAGLRCRSGSTAPAQQSRRCQSRSGNVVDHWSREAFRRRSGSSFLPARSLLRSGWLLFQEAIARRINADLADNIGNLAQRSLSMIVKNLERAPAPGCADRRGQGDRRACRCRDRILPRGNGGASRSTRRRHGSSRCRRGKPTGYFAAQAPWALAKNGDIARMSTVLYVTSRSRPPDRHPAAALRSAISVRNCWISLKIPAGERDFAHLGRPDA